MSDSENYRTALNKFMSIKELKLMNHHKFFTWFAEGADVDTQKLSLSLLGIDVSQKRNCLLQVKSNNLLKNQTDIKPQTGNNYMC